MLLRQLDIRVLGLGENLNFGNRKTYIIIMLMKLDEVSQGKNIDKDEKKKNEIEYRFRRMWLILKIIDRWFLVIKGKNRVFDF